MTRRAPLAGADKLFIGTLVTFTDGTDQAHLVTDEAAVASVTASTHYSFTIGLGGEIDETPSEKPRQIRLCLCRTCDALNGAFAEIAATIHSQSAKRYVLGYCTPSRSGDHRVTLGSKTGPESSILPSTPMDFPAAAIPAIFWGGHDTGRCGPVPVQGRARQSYYRPLFARSKRLHLTISSDEPFFSRKSTVEHQRHDRAVDPLCQGQTQGDGGFAAQEPQRRL